jgi:hypothetical protein
MVGTFEQDRGAQWLMAADPNLDPDAAKARLERACIRLSFDESLSEPWAQAAALTLAGAGKRMFRRGVYLDAPPDVAMALRQHAPGAFHRYLAASGARDAEAPEHAVRIHIGPRPQGGAFGCWTDGWSGCVGPAPPGAETIEGNEISGVLAGAMALAEVFRRHVLGDLRAARRPLRLSAWGLGEPADAALRFLPSDLWLLGLGNLGQANLWVLGFLPYWDPAKVRLLLQDFDVAGPENLDVQVLTEPDWLGRKKTRSAAAWADARGFRTVIEERPFAAETRPGGEEPRVLLGGVDNLEARRAAAAAGFDLVVDAGLGATAPEAFDLRLHGFPGRRSAERAWPAQPPAAAPVLSASLEKAVAEGRIDRCGALTVAGKSVGVPCTALTAAALQIGQVVRAIATGRCCDLVDVSLPTANDALFKVMDAELARPPAFTAATPR